MPEPARCLRSPVLRLGHAAVNFTEDLEGAPWKTCAQALAHAAKNVYNRSCRDLRQERFFQEETVMLVGLNGFLPLVAAKDIISIILLVVMIVFVVGFVMLLARRDKRRREERASAGIQKAAVMNTQQDFQLNTAELDLDALCGQQKIREIMNEDERSVLRAYAGGETEGELAGRLLISRKDAESLVSELFARLEVNNRAELLKKLQNMLREEEADVSK